MMRLLRHEFKDKSFEERTAHTLDRVKTCYIGPFATTQSPFLESKSSDLKKKHLNGVEVHIFFHFQVHTTII